MPKYFIPLLILSLIACCIEIDISVPSFPSISQHFQIDDSLIQMTLAYNFLGFFLGSALYGSLSDAYGRRPIMIWGNSILLIGAVGCTIAPSITFLLWARFIQGIGASSSAVIAFTMIADAYPNQEKASKLIGIMNAIFSILMALAPIIGGFINEAVGWRGNYGVVTFICFFSWVSLYFWLPETKTTSKKIILGKIKQNWQKLLTNFTFVSASIVPSLSYEIYLAFIAQAPFLYIETFKLCLWGYVFHQFIIVFIFAITSLWSSSLSRKLGPRRSIIIGISFLTLSGILLTAFSFMSLLSSYSLTSFMGLFCFGFAIIYPIIFSASLEIFPHIKGTASSLIMSMRSLICFSLVAISSYLYNGLPLRISLIILSVTTISFLFIVYLLKSPLFRR